MLSAYMDAKEMLGYYKDILVTDVYNLSNLDVSDYNVDNLNKIIEENPLHLQFIKNPSDDIIYKALSLNGHAIQYVDKANLLYNDFVLNALRNRVSSLQFIEQTEEIKKMAFRYTRYPFVFIKNPTHDDFCECLVIRVFPLSKAQIDYALEKYKMGDVAYVKRIYYKENFLKYAEDVPYDILKLALKSNPRYIKTMKQNEELAKIAIKSDYKVIKHIKCLTKEICLTAITSNANAYKFLPKEFKNEISSIEALKCNGMMLEFIENPSNEEIETAILQNGLAIKFVKDVSPEFALMSVKQNGLAIKYLDNQWYKACVTAVKSNNQLLKEIKDPKLRKTVKEAVEDFRKNKIYKYFSEIENKKLDENLIKIGLTKAGYIDDTYLDCLIMEIENNIKSLTSFTYFIGLSKSQISKGKYKKIFIINHFKDFNIDNYCSDIIVCVKDIDEILSIVEKFNK